jgi:CRP-like cAMP-binding protein
VTGFEESSVQYNIKFYLEDPGTALATKGKVFDKIWYALSREGIAFPYPHREIVEKIPSAPFAFDEAAVLEMIRKTELFSALDEKEVRFLAEKAEVKVFGPGEVVVRENDPGDSLFLVGRGSLHVFVGGAPVGGLGEGDIFGEMSLLTGEPRRATVVSAGEARLIEVEKSDLEPVLRSDPALIGRLSDILARREEVNLERTRAMVSVPSHESLVEGFIRNLKSFFNVT